MFPKSTAVALGLLCLTLLPLAADAGPRARRGWELLGETRVTDRADHDTLAVTAAQGTFRSLQLRVLGHNVQFHNVKLHFANGDVQDVELRNVIPAGGQSRVIDVQGSDRVIRSIEFWYDTQSLRGKAARVRVYGRN